MMNVHVMRVILASIILRDARDGHEGFQTEGVELYARFRS
jgi:hypothetical protein